MFIKKNTIYKTILVGLCVMTGAAVYLYHTQPQQQDYYIYEFNDDERDIIDVEKNFQDNFYWLTTRDNYDVRAMLQHRTSDFTDPKFNNNMFIYIMRDQATDTFIGFATFFKLSFYKGQVLFLSINSDFRGKRYGQTLIEHALRKMKEMGMVKATLFTRLDNSSARRLYERIGFKESSRAGNVGLYYDIYL